MSVVDSGRPGEVGGGGGGGGGRVAASEAVLTSAPGGLGGSEEPDLDDGGIVFTDKEQLELQRKVAWDLAKQIGNNLMEGKDLTR